MSTKLQEFSQLIQEANDLYASAKGAFASILAKLDPDNANAIEAIIETYNTRLLDEIECHEQTKLGLIDARRNIESPGEDLDKASIAVQEVEIKRLTEENHELRKKIAHEEERKRRWELRCVKLEASLEQLRACHAGLLEALRPKGY